MSPREEYHNHEPVAEPRKRTRRACDKCSRSRVRCDGKQPCRRCQEYAYACYYNREIRKRGPRPTVPTSVPNDQEATTPTDQSTGTTWPWRFSEDTIPHNPSPRLQDELLADGVDGDFPPRLESDLPDNTNCSPGLEELGAAAGIGSVAHSVASFAIEPVSAAGPLSTHEDAGLGMETFANHDNARTGREPFFTTQEPSINIDSPPIYAQSLPIQPSTRRPYKCLESLLPFLEGVIDSQAACELLDFYFAQPGNSLFQSASPYVLSHVVRKQSLLYAAQPRETTSALLSTMLWVSAQTADIPLLLLPGKRARVCETLRALAECLIEECNCGRECGHEKRQAGVTPPAFSSSSAGQIFANLPGKCDRSTAFPVDDVLTFVLFSIVVSGGDHKTNCYKWWNKAIMLARSSGLYSVDSDWSEASRSGLSHSSNHPKGDPTSMSLAALEAREERRRCFWLLFCLDRHLALSFNSTLSIADGEFEVFQPLPEDVWECLETAPIEALTHRVYGPLTTVTGIGFFEWFLALMSILGDIILVHHRRFHPRLGSLDDHEAVLMIEDILTKGAQSIADMRDLYEATAFETAEGPTRLGNSTLRDPGPTASQRSMKLA